MPADIMTRELLIYSTSTPAHAAPSPSGRRRWLLGDYQSCPCSSTACLVCLSILHLLSPSRNHTCKLIVRFGSLFHLLGGLPLSFRNSREQLIIEFGLLFDLLSISAL